MSNAKSATGRTRLERLILIGTCSSYLGVEALKLAVREARKGKDIKRYLEAQNHLETIGPQEPEAIRDKAWIEKTEKQNQAETQRDVIDTNVWQALLYKAASTGDFGLFINQF